MFEQDVAGLIKALRANKNDESKVIQQALDETRKEIKSKDLEVKAAAVLKLVYLEMLGHSIAFAAFAIVECMSSVKYHIKSIGYLASSQCFDRETEVAVLVVNLVKKDLLSPPTPLFSSSPSSLTVAHLLSTLSAVSLLLTPSLARDLAPDLLSMLTHSRPQVRKQTILVMWRVVRSWPEVTELGTGREERGEDPWIERLRERLGDDDIGVVSATVNLICELARKDPGKYLPLAPELFGLLTASTNNWMLIKIIKLFAALTPLEPRLVRKLLPPLTELIETTPAMSLLFECIQTSIVGGMLNGREGEALAATCVDKLKGFLEDVDQNLRYIALVALVKILPTHPHLVSIHHDTILACVDDADMSIRLRALDLVEGMVDRKSLRTIVERLMTHLKPSASTLTTRSSAILLLQAQRNGTSTSAPIVLSISYRKSLISLIIRVCSNSAYSNVSNFEWYIDTLVELSYHALSLPADLSDPEGFSGLGNQIRDQLIDVAARVRAIRPYAVRKMALLLSDETFLDNGTSDTGAEMSEVLGAAAWICGEYCQELIDPRPVIASLFGSNTSSSLPPFVLASYIHNGIKIYSSWLTSLLVQWTESDLDQIRSVTEALQDRLMCCAKKCNTTSGAEEQDVELQERGAELGECLELIRKGLDAPRPLASPSLDDEPTAGFGGDEEVERGFASTSAATLLPPSCLSVLSPLFFSHELNPVNPKAQGMVGVPVGLNLDLVIVPRASRVRSTIEGIEDAEEEVDDFGRVKRNGKIVPIGRYEEEEVGEERKKKKVGRKGKGKSKVIEETPEELARIKADRLERQRDDPYYIGSKPLKTNDYDEYEEEEEDVDSIPIVHLSLDLPSQRTPVRRSPTPPPVHIDIDGEMPDNLLDVKPPESDIAPSITPIIQADTFNADNIASEGAVLKVVKKKKDSKEVGSLTPKTKKKKSTLVTLE